MPQAQQAVHATLFDLVLGQEVDDAHVRHLLSRLQSGNHALEVLYQALEVNDASALEAVACEPAA